ncbi:glucosaminidase domain-containing protein [Staphylococcus agnetis]|uniref:glucosaminidase domain-containing protein n=1 Tax=Staphylococcus agnetis TaxID=985762 RepID=UPI000D02BFDF|nr:glucosaminidase domain-containing protein [Staphylococcus agnetis]
MKRHYVVRTLIATTLVAPSFTPVAHATSDNHTTEDARNTPSETRTHNHTTSTEGMDAFFKKYGDNEQNSSPKEAPQTDHQKENPQLPSKDDLTSSRDHAPQQASDKATKPTRQTTLFQTQPEGNNQTQLRVIEDPETRAFINKIAPHAHHIAKNEGIYASVMIAQAVLESDSGRSDLSKAPNHNLFGMKGQYQGASVPFQTLESDGKHMYQITADFRKYPSDKESLNDYASLIKNGIDGNPTIYKNVWKSQSNNYKKAAQGLVGTYATDPDYDQKLIHLIETYDLERYDNPELASPLSEGSVQKPATLRNVNFQPFKVAGGKANYPQGQCTWYVYHRMAQYNAHIASDMGNASDWSYNALTKGYKVTDTPQPHNAVVFQPNQFGADRYYGHVAFVEKVNDDGSIVISETNVKGLGVISYRTLDAHTVKQLDFITGQAQ